MRSNRDIEAELIELKRATEAALKQINRLLHEIRRRPADTEEPTTADDASRERVHASLSLSEELKKEVLEREEEQLPRAWLEAAERERERAGMPAVRLEVEYGRAVNWHRDKGREMRLGGWLVWVLRAWLDKANTPLPTAEPSESHAAGEVQKQGVTPAAGDAVLFEIKQRGELRALFERGHWSGRQGPKPGEPGCRYPGRLVEEYRLKYGRARHAHDGSRDQ